MLISRLSPPWRLHHRSLSNNHKATPTIVPILSPLPLRSSTFHFLVCCRPTRLVCAPSLPRCRFFHAVVARPPHYCSCQAFLPRMLACEPLGQPDTVIPNPSRSPPDPDSFFRPLLHLFAYSFLIARLPHHSIAAFTALSSCSSSSSSAAASASAAAACAVLSD